MDNVTNMETVFNSINPFTSQKLASFPCATESALKNSLEVGHKIFTTYWKFQTVEQRAIVIGKIGLLLLEQLEELAKLITLEMGKPIRQSRAEIEKCAWLCRYYADNGPTLLRQKTILIDGQQSYLSYQALGLILGIMPWNFPMWQSLRFAIPALLSGNTVLLKPAPNVPQCGLMLEKIVKEASGIAGLLQTSLLSVSQTSAIISKSIIKGVSFTGSDRAGAAVAAIAGAHIKPCLLELGGSDPFIVLQDADLDKAARMAVESRMNNTGQTCIAAKRWIVDASIAGIFIEKVIQFVKALKIGDPMDEQTDLGCLARPDIAKTLSKQVRESVTKGAEILLDGGQKTEENLLFHPMILSAIPAEAPAAKEELFGPVAALFIYNTIEDAVSIANSTNYGLGASIWTNDCEKGAHLAQLIESGTVTVNDMVRSDPRIPFGGIKQSGFGRELGEEGLLEFVNKQSVTIFGR